jgi:hypothetical protein
MIWFGSSAGWRGNLCRARSVGRWVRHGWFVPLAYVITFVMLAVWSWHPDAQHKVPSKSIRRVS